MKKPVLVRIRDEAAPRHVESMGMAGDVQNSWAPGQNYVPLCASAAAVTEVPAASKPTKLIRREDVLRPFLDALDIHVYHGRVRGNRLGYYMPKRETACQEQERS